MLSMNYLIGRCGWTIDFIGLEHIVVGIILKFILEKNYREISFQEKSKLWSFLMELESIHWNRTGLIFSFTKKNLR